jgi:glycosyltransferase involved in cell wall biosynthesis
LKKILGSLAKRCYWFLPNAMSTPEAANFLPYNLPVLHLFSVFRTLGGVEFLLRLHHELDPSIGVNSDLVIYHDEPALSGERLHCLGISGDDSIRKIGQKLGRVTDSRRDRIALYHLAWGFSYLCPVDHSARRVLALHTDSPDMRCFLQKNSHFLDGILCVNDGIRNAVVTALPGFPADRVGLTGYPIKPLGIPLENKTLSDPLRLAYAGRLTVTQKRVDRIPDFCAALERLGVNYQLDLLGEGAARPLLEARREAHNYHLRGALSGSSYWAELRKSDALVFFSEYEGTPIALLEGLSQGLIPVFPRIGSGGDAYVEQIDPALVYPPGDLKAAARILQDLSQRPGVEIEKIRARCKEAVGSHTVENYLKQTFNFIEKIQKLPRISKSSARFSVKALQFLTMNQISRLHGLNFFRRKR